MKIRKIAPKKMSTLAKSLAFAIGACGLAWPVYGVESNSYFDLTLEQLLETKVLSVSKKVETVAAAPAAIYVVTNEDIMRAGITNIPDALRMVPGVNVARSDSNSWAISIRGFNSVLSNKLLVLIDGRSIYNPVFGGVLWEAQNLMLSDIERIEVVRGPGGALWGANAVNGVINIITKHTRDTSGNVVSMLHGHEETNVAARHGGDLGDGAHYRVYAKAFKRDASLSPAGGDAYDEWDGVRTGFRVDWADEFSLNGNVYRTRTQQRKAHYSLVPPYTPVENQELTYEGANLLGRWVAKGDDGAQLSVQTYIDWARRDEPLNFIDDRTTYDVEVQYNLAPLGSHEIITGAGVRYMTDDKTGNNNVSFSPSRSHNSLVSAFVQDKIELSPDRWFLTLGSKFEHNEFSGFEVQPNVRLQWHPSVAQTLWSAISHAVRTPTPIEENLTSTLLTAASARAALVPNNDFKSEELTAYEIGYRQQISTGLSADFSVFYNDYEHLSTTSVQPVSIVNNGVDPLHLFIPIKFTNDMKGKSRGAEAAFNWTLSEDLKVALNYSYLKLDLTALDPAQKTAELLYPTRQTALKVFWNITDTWTLDSWATYIDKLPGGNVKAYTRLDMNLGGQITKTLRFNLIGQNLLEKSHREFGDAADVNAGEMERSIMGKLTWTF